MSSYADLANQVAKHLARDNGIKQRILEGSPHLYALDAARLAEMSAGELARHELKECGIEVSDASDPVEVHGAFVKGRMAGRMYERGRALGGAPAPAAMDGATPGFLDKYLQQE